MSERALSEEPDVETYARTLKKDGNANLAPHNKCFKTTHHTSNTLPRTTRLDGLTIPLPLPTDRSLVYLLY